MIVETTLTHTYSKHSAPYNYPKQLDAQALKVTKRAPLPDSTTYHPGKENLKEPAQNSERSNQKANFLR